MPRVSYKITDEEKAIATDNGIPLSTLYSRLRNGWDRSKAISTPSAKMAQVSRDDNGEVISQNLGKQRTFRLPDHLDDKLDHLIEESGLSASEYVREVMIRHLQR